MKRIKKVLRIVGKNLKNVVELVFIAACLIPTALSFILGVFCALIFMGLCSGFIRMHKYAKNAKSQVDRKELVEVMLKQIKLNDKELAELKKELGIR